MTAERTIAEAMGMNDTELAALREQVDRLATPQQPLGDCTLCGDPSYLEVDGRPCHPCCDHWAERGYGRCPACSASRAAERRTPRRREKANA